MNNIDFYFSDNKFNKINNIGFKPIEKVNNYDNISPWLQDGEIKTYKKYTQAAFKSINQALRFGYCDDLNLLDYIKKMDNIFDKLPQKFKNKKPLEVYRGLKLNFDLERDLLNPGSVFVEKGFCSTSHDKLTAKQFADGEDGILMRILIPKDSTIIDDEKLPNFAKSLINTEKEVLLPRNAQFQIISYNPERKMVEAIYLGQKKPLEMPKSFSDFFGSEILADYNKINIVK